MFDRASKFACTIQILIIMLGLLRASSRLEIDDDVGTHGLTETVKLKLWSLGVFDFDMEPHNVRPASYVRQEALAHRVSPNCDLNGYCRIRGGNQDQSLNYEEHIAQKINELGLRFGPEFLAAIEKNKIEHAEDCKQSCEIYYCAHLSEPLVPFDDVIGETTIKSYSMGPVPPEDFAESFGYVSERFSFVCTIRDLNLLTDFLSTLSKSPDSHHSFRNQRLLGWCRQPKPKEWIRMSFKAGNISWLAIGW